jgi:hypothetical protein
MPLPRPAQPRSDSAGIYVASLHSGPELVQDVFGKDKNLADWCNTNPRVDWIRSPVHAKIRLGGSNKFNIFRLDKPITVEL